ncbi:hypothetical protein ACOSQ2_018677 [Xanthoceras sorbifolium]
MLGEFLALREDLVLVKFLNLKVCMAEVDASNVSFAVNSCIPFGGDASFIVDDITALCLEVRDCKCLSISRFGNRLAHSWTLWFCRNYNLNRKIKIVRDCKRIGRAPQGIYLFKFLYS